MTAPLPPRWSPPSLPIFIAWLIFLALLVSGLRAAEISPQRTVRGAERLVGFLGEAFPPDLTRLPFIGSAILETLQIAIVGVALGVLASVPLALLSARNTCGFAPLRALVRTMVSTMRTVPDLVWALVFVIAVGLGPFAGILAIMVDSIGFCGRFFRERIEEAKPGPIEALRSTGARRRAVILGAILPECLPSFTATSLYAVEKAVRSAVVLGLVGAGGIGVELSASMDQFKYREAMTVILAILLVVIVVESLSGAIRRRVM
jgi:phosphonate transport system permease protein